MQVISLEQTKAQLGITSTTYDSQINAKLPIIDAKVKQISNYNYNYRFAADMTGGSNVITVYPLYTNNDNYPSGINNPHIIKDISKSLEIGMLVEGDNIPADTYITNFYKQGSVDLINSTSYVVYAELSENISVDGSSIEVTGGISIAYHDVIAKGVQYLINGTSMSINDTSWTSKSSGPLSVTKGDANSKLDGKSGMPAWFVKGLPRYI